MSDLQKGQAAGQVCPFCGAGWTDGMFALLERYSLPSACACCGGEHEHSSPPMPQPTEDICCEACRKPIYRALSLASPR